MIRTQFRYLNLFRFQVTNVRPGDLDRTRDALGWTGKISDWYIDYTPQGLGRGYIVVATDLPHDAMQAKFTTWGWQIGARHGEGA